MKRLTLVVLALLVSACDGPPFAGPPPIETSIDTELRRLIGSPYTGAIPIGDVAPQDPARVALGRSLFFDKILSGNRDVSCATCHNPSASLTDGRALAIGTGGSGGDEARTVGSGRQFVPRNAPTLVNGGLGFNYMLWDGRLQGHSTFFNPPPGIVFPQGLSHILAAQAMLPVLNRTEMRGDAGDVDRFGGPNELATISDSNAQAVWNALMQRLLSYQEYVAQFSAAYPGVATQQMGFQHAANALAAFQMQSFIRKNSAFDRYLARDNGALSDGEKRGALLFFGKARCSFCHTGALLGGQQFANIGVPQIGPGVGLAAPLDVGRGEQIGADFYRFAFRVPPLRNVELTAPYMHNGAYRTLEQVVRHYTNVDSSLRAYDATQLDEALRATHRGDASTIQAVLATLDGRVRNPIQLTVSEQGDLVAFLKSLTDPAARDLSAVVPASVPSGLPIRE